MSPNDYVANLRAERDALRAKVARVEELAARYEMTAKRRHTLAERWMDEGRWQLADGFRNLECQARINADRLRDALSGDVSSGSERLSTDSDPAATERQGEAEGAGDHV